VGKVATVRFHRWDDIRRSKGDPAREARIRKGVEAELVEMSLADLRRELGVTQVDMAIAADMSQGDVSRLEHRDDYLVSTLRRAVRALGGDIEVVAVVGEKRIKLSV
jgi:hypothetical protein